MATPDHKALARSSFTLDAHLSPIPESSHAANTAAPASMARLAGTYSVRRQRGVPLPATTRVARRDGRPPMGYRPEKRPRTLRAASAVNIPG